MCQQRLCVSTSGALGCRGPDAIKPEGKHIWSYRNTPTHQASAGWAAKTSSAEVSSATNSFYFSPQSARHSQGDLRNRENSLPPFFSDCVWLWNQTKLNEEQLWLPKLSARTSPGPAGPAGPTLGCVRGGKRLGSSHDVNFTEKKHTFQLLYVGSWPAAWILFLTNYGLELNWNMTSHSAGLQSRLRECERVTSCHGCKNKSHRWYFLSKVVLFTI